MFRLIDLRHFFFLFFSFGHTMQHVGISVPQPGLEPMPPAVEAWSPNHWTTREFPDISSFLMKEFKALILSTTLVVPHAFDTLFSFSFSSKYFLISSVISSFIHELFESVLFSIPIFGESPDIFLLNPNLILLWNILCTLCILCFVAYNMVYSW